MSHTAWKNQFTEMGLVTVTLKKEHHICHNQRHSSMEFYQSGYTFASDFRPKDPEVSNESDFNILQLLLCYMY